MKYIDMHIHSNNSDGMFTPTEIVKMANFNETKIIAISDHDSISGLQELKSNLLQDMVGVSAVEFSSYLKINNVKFNLHILGYGFNENNNNILKLLDEMRNKRVNSHIEIINKVKDKFNNIPEESINSLNFDRYCWFDREILKCMEIENYPIQLIKEFKDFCKNNRFNYGDEYEVDAKKVIDTIKGAEGISIFAHPMSYNLNKCVISEIMVDLYRLGIDGIELYQSDCNFYDRIFLNEEANKYNILCSVGSDFHRLINSDERLIGRGINNNLCISETSLTNKILEKKLYFKGGK